MPPTAERLRKARQEGKVPQSKELSAVVMLLVLAGALVLMGGNLLSFFREVTTASLSRGRVSDFDVTFVRGLLAGQTYAALLALLPIFALASGAAILSSMVPGGATFTLKAVKVKWQAISIVSGVKRFFSAKSLVTLLVSIGKIGFVLGIAYLYVRGRTQELALLWGATPGRILLSVGALSVGLVVRLALAMLILAVGDCLYQRWQYMRDMRMTLQEVKEERKEHEGNPQVKARMRSIQMQMSRRRMLSEVKNADVVVTNPTHYAVALRYDPPAMEAPTVVAKGKDHLAEKVKELARKHGVPVVERPELARMLYATVEPGQQVPEALYVAVANVLAFIYRGRTVR